MHFTRFDFLKTYQKEKQRKKKQKKNKNLDIFPTSFQLTSPSAQTTCPLCCSLEQLTQLRISFLQDEVPF